MAAGQSVALKQTLALVLGKLLDNVTNWGDVLVVLEVVVEAAEPLLVGYLEGWLQTVGSGLVRSEDTELGAVAVDELSGVLAEDARCLSSTKAVALLGNWISYFFASGRTRLRRIAPPFALGLAPRRRSPLGMKAVTSGRIAPFSVKRVSGL